MSAPGTGGLPPIAARCPRQAGRHRGLPDAEVLLERPAGHQVRMARRLGERQHRRDAGVGAVEHRRPLVAGAARRRPRRSGSRSTGHPATSCWAGRSASAEPEQPQQFGVELGFQCADRHVPAVSGRVDVVERRAAVEQVAATLGSATRPAARRPANSVVRWAAPSTMAASTTCPRPGGPGHVQRRQAADDEVERAAAEVADEVERDLRRPAGAADRVQRAGDGDVVDVVAGGAGQRPVLSPAGHPSVDQARVALQRSLRSDARAVRPRPGRQPSIRIAARSASSRTTSAPSGCFRSTTTDRLPRLSRSRPGRAGRQRARLRPVDPDDVGAQVGQQHRARTGPGRSRRVPRPGCRPAGRSCAGPRREAGSTPLDLAGEGLTEVGPGEGRGHEPVGVGGGLGGPGLQARPHLPPDHRHGRR